MRKWPNASITLPASPFVRMSRVELTLSARRNTVITSSSAGNDENSSGSRVPRATSSTTSDTAIDSARQRSRSTPGSGTTSSPTTASTATAIPDSARPRPARASAAAAAGITDALTRPAGRRRARGALAGGPLPHDEGEHLGDGEVQLGRDHHVDLDAPDERAGERDVLDHGHPRGEGELLDALGDLAPARRPPRTARAPRRGRT
jgi:hypothetical protein